MATLPHPLWWSVDWHDLFQVQWTMILEAHIKKQPRGGPFNAKSATEYVNLTSWK
jgi:hypothetical protein